MENGSEGGTGDTVQRDMLCNNISGIRLHLQSKLDTRLPLKMTSTEIAQCKK